MTADGDGTAPARRPRTPRLLAVCAVLLGLFFMHGAPASASEGCHGVAVTMDLDMDLARMSSAASVDATVSATVSVAVAATTRATPHVRPQAPASHVAKTGSGGTCWATPVRARAPLTGWAQVAFALLPLAGAGLAASGTAPSRDRRRTPPPGGRAISLRVCVART
ncbi:hypothetical protein [Streptomyces sp. CBMA29]|uniref:hypothetical protein n=1 Tax=Streptomyces sp. CBMA29 TaxID=1896314 RepID=UPI001661D281|nr:hypothetical protein [Streptomyces sp. CBMA29]MBD0737326.1 hypothetical protein [Streptomyces sp. CBMA29]